MRHSSEFDVGATPVCKKLTPRQDAYCRHFVVTNCKAEAIRRAGSRSKNPALDGYKMHMKPEVQAKIAELRLERMKRLEFDADEVLRRLLELLNADLGDIFGPDFDMKPVSEWPSVWREGLIEALKVRHIECDPAKHGATRIKLVKIKLFDRMSLLRTIGNHVSVRAFR